MPAIKKQSCFVIAPIGSNDSDIRKRSNQVLKHLFKKALDEKYEVIRGDEIDAPGMITSQVLRAVQESHLVVADLTEHNPNVLYELAVRHAIEKPIIHVIETRLSKIPFDIAGFRTIDFNLTDPDSIELAVERLKKYAEQAESGNWGETPIKLANIMRASKEDSSEMLLLKQAVEGISNVSARLANLEAPWPTGGVLGSRIVNLGSLAGVNASYDPTLLIGKAVTFEPFPNADGVLVDDIFRPRSVDGQMLTMEAETQAPKKKEDKEPSQPRTPPKK
jgi:hypothetical protein